MPTIFANPANPVLTPWFILLFKYGGRESWGGGEGGGGLGYDMGLAVFTSTLLGRYVIFRPKIAVSIFQTFQTFEVSKIRPAVS